MADVSLGRLFIRFGIDDADLKKGKAQTERELKSLEKRTQQFQASITRTLGRVAPWLTISAAVLGIGRAFVSMAQDARALEDLRIQSGMSVRSLMELREMVNRTGGTMNDLTTAVTAYNKAIFDASRDSRSEAAQAFRELGVSIRDANGNLTSLDDATEQIATKFAGWTDGVNKAAIAQAVFGGGAQAMTRALNQGEEGIRKAREEIDRYGRSAEDIHKTQLEWVNNTNDLLTALTHFRDQVILPLIPGLISAVDLFGQIAAKVKKFGEAVLEAYRTERLKFFSEKLAETQQEQVRLYEELAKITDKTGQAMTGQEGNHQSLQKKIADTDAELKKLVETQQHYLNLLGLTGMAEGGGDAPKPPPKDQPRRIGTGGGGNEQRAIKAMLDDVSLLNQHLNGLPTQLGLITEVNRNTYDQMQQKVTETLDTIKAKYKDQEDTIRNLHNLKLQLAREEQDTALQTADMVGSAISSMFSKSKAAAMAETIIHTATAVMRALRDVPWPYNLVQAAAIAAQGAAQLAKIRSTTEKGGGGGGSGGIAASAPASAPTQHALHVQGVDRASLYTGAVVENIIEAINEKVQQGVTLISTKNVPV